MGSLKTRIEEINASDDQPVRVVLRDRRKEPILTPQGQEAYVMVLGRESTAFRKADDAFQRRRSKQRNAPPLGDPAEWRRYQLHILNSVIVEWNAWDGDSTLPLTPENIKDVFKSDTLRSQVWVDGIEEHEDFFASTSDH